MGILTKKRRHPAVYAGSHDLEHMNGFLHYWQTGDEPDLGVYHDGLHPDWQPVFDPETGGASSFSVATGAEVFPTTSLSVAPPSRQVSSTTTWSMGTRRGTGRSCERLF